MSIGKCVAIVNSHGGTRKGLSALDELSRSLCDAGVVFDSHVTQHA
jgi:diacylglycerol kinase family enzyme